MSSIFDLISDKLGGDTLKNLSAQLGTSENETGNAVNSAVPVLLGALARNSSNDEGARSLDKALERDHDGGILQNLGSALGQGGGDGAGILGHVLGGKQPAVEAGIAKQSGMDQGKVGSLLGMLAPVVMGALGQKKKESGLDAGGVAGLLNQERQQVEKSGGGILTGLLDQDGDGDLDLGDLTKGIGKMFG